MKAAIIGASGYGGVELIRILQHHPHLEQLTIFSSSTVGEELSVSYPHTYKITELAFNEINPEAISECADVVFLATPNGISNKLTPQFEKLGLKVIDLSGDLRIKDSEVYEEFYNLPFGNETTVQRAVYGLTEWNKENIAFAQTIANPGCYATAALLGLLPITKANIVQKSPIIIDAKSGVTGAGRSLNLGTHYSEINENFKAYKIHQHQHIPEIQQLLIAYNGELAPIMFTPHLVPMLRGIMCTMYVTLTEKMSSEEVHAIYEEAYANKPFVRVRPLGSWPSTKEVKGSNYCDISVAVDERTGLLTIVSTIDNLMKGAAGQAVQNMNVMFNFNETDGLTFLPVYP
ncbi:MAG: N-acetyl-gamma-glutamyl-phosphate reductase [Bacilli bacterium]